MLPTDVCKDKKSLQETNRCVNGFQRGLKKLQMEDDLAEGSLGRHYGDGYKKGRELAFKQTGSTRRKSQKARKTRRNKNVNGRK